MDIDIAYGNPGDLPLVGDWYGHGWDSVGVSRGTLIYLKGQNGLADIAFQCGSPGDTYITGRFGGLSAPYFGQQFIPSTLSEFSGARCGTFE